MKMYDMIKKVISTKAYAARTIEADPLQSFMFRVNIPGLPSTVGFQKVGGLSREVEVIEYFENMYEHAHKLPGRETVGDVTFERGMYEDAALQKQYETVFHNNTVRTTVTLNVCDRFGKIRRTFNFDNAWFSKYEIADFDATSSDVVIETLTMVFESFI